MVTSLAALVALFTFAVKVRQDRDELRRRQAENARSMLEGLYGDLMSSQAMDMLDYENKTYHSTSFKASFTIDHADVIEGLRCTHTQNLSLQDLFLRQVFDALFVQLAIFANALQVGQIAWSDIEKLIGYYVFMIRRDSEIRETVTLYCDNYGFPGVATLIRDDAIYPTRKYRQLDDGLREPAAAVPPLTPSGPHADTITHPPTER